MQSINELISFIKEYDGIANKVKLEAMVSEAFDLIKDRKVYYCATFALRFSFSSSGSFSNTVLSLSLLQKYDHVPFLVCLVTPVENRVYLANSTFLSKISHSSQTLSMKNIKGSFNGSDILKTFEGIDNNRDNIKRLFAIHTELGFEGNLARLVEATHNIVPTGTKFYVGVLEKKNIVASIQRSKAFCESLNYKELKEDLDLRVEKYKETIIVASHVENVNIRGRLIEYLIAGDDEQLKQTIVRDLNVAYSRVPAFKTENTLGDYTRIFDSIHTETDIKTKIVLLNSNPKAYNIDKFLEFHSEENTVLLFYFIGIGECEILNKILVPVFQRELINGTILLKHWAGRNSRGVTQFEGNTIHKLLENPYIDIDQSEAESFLEKLLAL